MFRCVQGYGGAGAGQDHCRRNHAFGLLRRGQRAGLVLSEGVRTLVGTNAVVLPAQYRQVASVEGAVIILVPHRTVENFLGDPLTGVALRVEGSATLSVAQYKGISVTRAGTGTVTVVASGGDEMLDRVDHINTIRINAGAALTMDVADLSSVTVHKEGGLLYGSVKEDAVAADYPLVDGFYVQAGTFTVRQADQGRVVSNHAVVRLEGATAAPTAPGEVNIVVAPFEPTSLALASQASAKSWHWPARSLTRTLQPSILPSSGLLTETWSGPATRFSCPRAWPGPLSSPPCRGRSRGSG